MVVSSFLEVFIGQQTGNQSNRKAPRIRNKQKTLSRQSLLTHDRKRSLAYNEDEQYKSVVFNRAFPS